MPDYKELYLDMVRGTEKAINILIDTQRRCEEMYLNAADPEIVVLPERGKDDQESDAAPVS